MKFSDVIKTLCVCGCVFGSMCDDVRGMMCVPAPRDHTILRNDGKIIKTLEVNNVDELYDLPLEAVYKIERLSFNNIAITDKLVRSLDRIRTVDNLSFYECVSADYSFADLIGTGCPSDSLSIIKCGLSIEQARRVLISVDPHSVRHIDFSQNGFDQNSYEFRELLRNYVNGVMLLDQMQLCVD